MNEIILTVFGGATVGAAIIAALAKVFEKVFDRHNVKADRKDSINSELKALKASQERTSVDIADLKATVEVLNYATQQDLRDRILRNAKAFLKQGFVEVDEYEALRNLYEAYHRCGGNGYLTDVMEKIKSLPMKDE